MPALNGSADSAGLEHKRKSERKNSYESKSGNTGKSFLSQIIAEPKPARGGHHAGDGGLQYGGYLLHRPDQRPVQDCRHLPVLPHVLHPLRAGNPARQRRLYRHLPGSREKGYGDRETLFLLLLLCGPCPGHGVSVVGQSPSHPHLRPVGSGRGHHGRRGALPARHRPGRPLYHVQQCVRQCDPSRRRRQGIHDRQLRWHHLQYRPGRPVHTGFFLGRGRGRLGHRARQLRQLPLSAVLYDEEAAPPLPVPEAVLPAPGSLLDRGIPGPSHGLQHPSDEPVPYHRQPHGHRLRFHGAGRPGGIRQNRHGHHHAGHGHLHGPTACYLL